MAPRPLRQIKRSIPNITYTIGFASLTRSPEMAVMAMKTIACWSEIESQVVATLVVMLGGDARPAIAMVLALTSTQAQMAALEAAARAVLNEEAMEIFLATLAVIRKAVKRRHVLAHWIWAFSEQIPDCMLLIDPKEQALFEVFQMEEIDSPNGVKLNSEAWGNQIEGVWAYKLSDLSDIHQESVEILSISIKLCSMISDLGMRHGMSRLLLLNEPRIRTEMEKRSRKVLPTPAPKR